MNILYVTQWFSPVGGGGEVVFHTFANGLAQRGHHVDVVSHQLANQKDDQPDSDISLHRVKPMLKGSPPPSLSENISFIIYATMKCSAIIRQKKIDIIHVNNLGPIVVGSNLSKFYRIPLIITIHDIFTTSSPNHWKNWIAQSNSISRLTSIIAPFFEKLTVKAPADIIHTVSNSTREDLRNFKARSEIIVIPNGIDAKNYERYEKHYDNYIMFMGRLVFYKNLGVVISAFKEVVKKIPEAKLIAVGDGPMRKKWETMAAELNLSQSIIFTGYISQEQKMDLLSKCSAVVLPSFVEGFPIAALEALAMSKPVLLADIAPSYEIVDEGINGFILSPYDHSKWSEKIIFLLSNKEMCKNMGRQARIKAENKFDIEKVLDKIESLYERFIRK